MARTIRSVLVPTILISTMLASPGLVLSANEPADPAATGRRTAAVDDAASRGDQRMRRPSLAVAAAPWRVSAFRIRTLTPAERYEVRGRISTAWPPTAIHDRFGVPMRIYGGRRHYHPVGLARLGLQYLANYRQTGNRLYVDRAERIATGLRRIALSARGGLWFPYRFTWTMHGNPALVNRPPWYSGMSQGLALALFSRLWEYTGREIYRTAADLTYNSMRAIGRGSNPWVTWIDRNRYVWIDEYPQQLDQTLNGYVFALAGVYDYFQLTKDQTRYTAARNASVLELLRGGITTIRAYTPTFRNPGTVSDYCLGHHYRNPNYHPTHVRLLRYLTVMTGDPWFGRMAALFAADVR
jgi:D-glucuronyl C5-epimerase C-terminus